MLSIISTYASIPAPSQLLFKKYFYASMNQINIDKLDMGWTLVPQHSLIKMMMDTSMETTQTLQKKSQGIIKLLIKCSKVDIQ